MSPDYERTGVWLTILRLCYGFSLGALRACSGDGHAPDDYVAQWADRPVDLWLDPRWHRAYQRARRGWEEQARG